MNGVSYPFDATYTGTQWGNTYLGTAKTQHIDHENASKFNVGFDATLFGGLNISADYYYQHRYDIWYSTAGSYSSVFGMTAPEEPGRSHQFPWLRCIGRLQQEVEQGSHHQSWWFPHTQQDHREESGWRLHSSMPILLLQASDTARHSVISQMASSRRVTTRMAMALFQHQR